MDGPTCAPGEKSHRHMVEHIAATPFFKRHGSHMAATIKLSAEFKNLKDRIVLESDLCGYGKEDVSVSASPNSIDVTLVLDRNDGAEVKFHSSYITPSPIDDKKVTVEFVDGKLKVSAPKRRG
jgi:HSP20 family molecular chaperone IbpA